ncbi:MAG: hypothetical protein IKZ99_10920 [Salinivirgaceae bacterium]|nr:hypothetical protein [Salinivirgaceae bacterium]
MSNTNKEKLTQAAKRIKEFVKVYVERILVNKGMASVHFGGLMKKDYIRN